VVKVVLWGSLRPHAGGQQAVEISAATIRELLSNLGETYPGLRPQLQRGIAVAVDGVVYRDDWQQPIGPESEVILLPRLQGG
jgi:molybdopterin converting factor small subunit